MLTNEGARFSISSRKRDSVDLTDKVPKFADLFQINERLYVCALNEEEEQSYFFSLDYSGQRVQLEAMRSKRDSVTFCGLSSQLLIIGGFNLGNLRLC